MRNSISEFGSFVILKSECLNRNCCIVHSATKLRRHISSLHKPSHETTSGMSETEIKGRQRRLIFSCFNFPLIVVFVGTPSYICWTESNKSLLFVSTVAVCKRKLAHALTSHSELVAWMVTKNWRKSSSLNQQQKA